MDQQKLAKIEDIILQAINKTLLQELEAPKDVMITVNRLKLYADLSQAIVYYTIFPDYKLGTAKRFFKEKKKKIQYFFEKNTNLYRVPKLFFRYDSEEMENRAFDELLNSAFASLPPKSTDIEE